MLNDPSVIAADVAILHDKIRLPQALMGGTDAMREASTEFLPKEKAEKQPDYDSRLARSFLFSGFERTLAILTGEVFDKPVTLAEETPEEFKVLADDIDQQGNNLTRFTRSFFERALYNGLGFILIDTPTLPTDSQGNPVPTTAAEDKLMGRRLYWVHVPAGNLLGAKVETVNGAQIIQQFRFMETVKVSDGLYSEVEVSQVRVLEPGKWETFRKNDKGDWMLWEAGGTGLSYVPIVPFYTGVKQGFFDVYPPLTGLAELNQAHWISSSDQNNILHFARVPFLFGKGLDKDDNGQIVIAARNLLHSDSTDADLKFVEHSGKAIGDGWRDLERLETLMSLWGLELISNNRSGNVTATERALVGAKTGSFLNSVALDCQDALNSAIKISCEIMRVPFAGGAVINTDFSLAVQNFDSQSLILAFDKGLLDRVTVIDELKRRGLVGENVDPVVVMAGIENDARSSSFGNIAGGLLTGTGV